MSDPVVSVIVPAERAHGLMADAVATVARSGLHPDQVEIIICPMDEKPYNSVVPHWCNVRYTTQRPYAQTMGEARNNGISIASGRYVAFLNPGDDWADDYLKKAMLSLNDGRVAFSQTSARGKTREFLRVPAADYLDFSIMSESGSSFHPVVDREIAGPFFDRPSEDIMHAMEVLSLSGGRAPVFDAPYIVRAWTGPVDDNDEFSARVSSVYQFYEEMIKTDQTRVAKEFVSAAVKLLRVKAEINARYAMEEYSGHFYSYVASKYASGGVPAWLKNPPSFEVANP